MEIKIGIRQAQRELTLETDEATTTIEQNLAQALTSHGVFKLTDTKGRITLVPADAIAYIDLGSEHVRPVGFGAV